MWSFSLSPVLCSFLDKHPSIPNFVETFGLHYGGKHTQTHGNSHTQGVLNLLGESRQILSQAWQSTCHLSHPMNSAHTRTPAPTHTHTHTKRPANQEEVSRPACMKPARQEVKAMSQEIGCVFSPDCRIPAIRASRWRCLDALLLHLHAQTVNTHARATCKQTH